MTRPEDMKTNKEVLAEEMRRDPRFRWQWALAFPYRKLSVWILRWKLRRGDYDG